MHDRPARQEDSAHPTPVHRCTGNVASSMYGTMACSPSCSSCASSVMTTSGCTHTGTVLTSIKCSCWLTARGTLQQHAGIKKCRAKHACTATQAYISLLLSYHSPCALARRLRPLAEPLVPFSNAKPYWQNTMSRHAGRLSQGAVLLAQRAGCAPRTKSAGRGCQPHLKQSKPPCHLRIALPQQPLECLTRRRRRRRCRPGGRPCPACPWV